MRKEHKTDAQCFLDNWVMFCCWGFLACIFAVFEPTPLHAWQSGISYNLNTCTNSTCTAAPSTSVCSGVSGGSDVTTIQNFNTAALAWQTGGGSGLVHLTIPQNQSTLSVSNVSNVGASTFQITTSTSFSWSTGQWVTLSGLGGVQWNGGGKTLNGQITVLDGTDFTMAIYGFQGTYTSGGVVNPNVCEFPTSAGNPFGGGLLQVLVTLGDGLGIATGVAFEGSANQYGGVATKSLGPFAATSNTSLTLSPGTQTLTINSQLITPPYPPLFAGETGITIADASNSGNAFTCSVTSFNTSTFVGVFNCPTVAGSGTFSSWNITPGFFFTARAATVAAGATQITLLTPSAAQIFTPGTYALMAGIDLQGGGYPIDPGFWDYVYINTVDTSTGVITFTSTSGCPTCGALSSNYEATWPVPKAASRFINDNGGAATLYALDPSWSLQIEFDGLIMNTGESYADALSVTYQNGAASAYQLGGTSTNCATPTQNHNFTMINMDMGACETDVDKVIDNATYTGVTIHQILFQSASVKNFVLNGGTTVTGLINGSPIHFSCANDGTSIASFSPGSYAFGASVSAVVNCQVNAWGSLSVKAQTSNFTMSGGVITWPNSNNAAPWAAPGYCLYWTNITQAGFPMCIVDMTQDATNTYIQTTLAGGIPPLSGQNLPDNFSLKAFTLTNCSGSATSADLCQAPAGTGLWTQTIRTYNTFPQHAFQNTGYALGALVSMTLNVTTPYTGVNPTQTVGILLNLTNANGTLQSYVGVINTKITGARVITPTGVTGTQTGDNGLSVGGPVWLNALPYSATWAAGNLTTECASGGAVCPVITITINTTQSQQGIYSGSSSTGPTAAGGNAARNLRQ